MPLGFSLHRLVMCGIPWMLAAGAAGVPAVSVAASFQSDLSAPATAQPAPADRATPPAKAKSDLSGHRRVGKASFYAHGFAGKTMADGTPMDPRENNAASKTLPLGTTAKVKNLETGKSAVVTIQDRGPYVEGRIIDLSPATARKIGIVQADGVARVEVVPIAVPLPDGSVKPGAAAADGKVQPDH